MRIRYERLGGIGITKVLYECSACGCAVSDQKAHTKWHEGKS